MATSFMLRRDMDVSVLARKVLSYFCGRAFTTYQLSNHICMQKIFSTLKPFSHYVYNKIQTREKDYKPKKVEREPYTGPVIQL